MKTNVEVALTCVLIFISWLHISCDESEVSKWTCSCATDKVGSETYSAAANCSTFCDCYPEEAESEPSGGDKSTCLCAAEGFPKAPDSFYDSSCFTDCNCTLGISSEQKVEKKDTASKVVVYVLLLSILLTTLAFFASLGWYVYRRDRYSNQRPTFQSDKNTSCTSVTNLISYGSSSMSALKSNRSSPLNPISGCIRNVSLMFGNKRGTLPGIIFQFSYTELELATNKFDKCNLIGLGGSSHVYRGQLKDGRFVAVKRLKTHGGHGADDVFLTEIELISRLHHCHVIPLLGYCSESQGRNAERLLVFEYMPNGNLRDCLDGAQGKERLDWGTRIGIALGAARGLEYLHEAAAPRILHRDVKSTNILLDDKWRAKITDLGMAKSLMTDDLASGSSSPARMQGTFGYFAPEYAIIGRASLKSDVFSFGVVLLELISGRQPIYKSSTKGGESLVIWAAPRLLDSKRVISELADPLLKGRFLEEEMHVMAYLAKECLLLDPVSRPTMSEVVHILSTISPDKSRRLNFPPNLFQSSFGESTRRVMDIEKQEEIECSVVADELRSTASERWSPRCSLSLPIDHALIVKGKSKENTSISADYLERLILLTSKARSWRSQDDDSVDLTEPRFESFLLPNVHSI